MIIEPKQAKLLIHGMNKACDIVNAQCSTSLKTTKDCIGPSFAKYSLCNKQLHGDVYRLKETLTSMSRWIITVHLKKNLNKTSDKLTNK